MRTIIVTDLDFIRDPEEPIQKGDRLIRRGKVELVTCVQGTHLTTKKKTTRSGVVGIQSTDYVRTGPLHIDLNAVGGYFIAESRPPKFLFREDDAQLKMLEGTTI